ncbi:MAG: hypothetical protein SFU87_17045 [Chitinophagaceae bacterium]|nr:hypothetical protein [Chitinophagaceae bacterium]
MIRVNRKEVPLSVLNEINHLLTQLRHLSRNQQNIIESNEDGDFVFYAKDRDPKSRFYFIVEKFEQNPTDLITYFTTRILPVSETKIEEKLRSRNSNETIHDFENWISLVLSYNNINLNPGDQFDKIYEQEFYDLFEIIDEDADQNPFELKKQLLFYDFLEVINKKLEYHKNEEGISEILVESKELQIKLSILTKKTAIKRLSKVMSMIRKKGISFLKEIMTEVKKALLKRAIDFGFDNWGKMIDYFN